MIAADRAGRAAAGSCAAHVGIDALGRLDLARADELPTAVFGDRNSITGVFHGDHHIVLHNLFTASAGD